MLGINITKYPDNILDGWTYFEACNFLGWKKLHLTSSVNDHDTTDTRKRYKKDIQEARMHK